MSSVTVIIPTFERYDALGDAVDSVLLQTHRVMEIIVIDDASLDPRYREFSRPLTRVIRRERNTLAELGYPACGVVRNEGLPLATGDYIAFCDDDDVWLPWKLERQLEALASTRCRMSSTEGYYCHARWDSSRLTTELLSGFERRYPLYNREHYWPQLKRRCQLENDLPTVWTRRFMARHNSMVVSSVIVERSLVEEVGGFAPVAIGREDYQYWMRLLEHTDSAYVETPCFGYCSGRPKRSRRNLASLDERVALDNPDRRACRP